MKSLLETILFVRSQRLKVDFKKLHTHGASTKIGIVVVLLYYMDLLPKYINMPKNESHQKTYFQWFFLENKMDDLSHNRIINQTSNQRQTSAKGS